ncbi:MAG: Lar family restriction alleviation protein [Defluviitaleaceae bacterium]|nr:Lar family restriction alleviation protein [Defluviitaleaceae bacterium]
MARFSLDSLMNDHSKGKKHTFTIKHYDIDLLEPSPTNFYTVDDVKDLMDSIELYGLQQNLLTQPQANSNKIKIISGERRYTALKQLVAMGKEEYKQVPCKDIVTTDDIQAEMQLILANSTSRRLTDYELTHQAARLKDLLTSLKKGGYKFTGRKRDIIADMLKVSASQINRYESINKNLSQELKEEFKNEGINVTTAYELSKISPEKQTEALNDHKSGAHLTPETAKEYAAPKKNNEASLDRLIEKNAPQEAGEDIIKPCPFCGGSASLNKEYENIAPRRWVTCDTCLVATFGHSSKEDALAAWNKRVK